MDAVQDAIFSWFGSATGETWNWFNSLSREEWVVVLGVGAALGFLCMRGLTTRI